MLRKVQPVVLVATANEALKTRLRTVLEALPIATSFAADSDAAEAAVAGSMLPSVVLLDEHLPGMPADQLLARLHGSCLHKRFTTLLMAEAAGEAWLERINEGTLDGIVLTASDEMLWHTHLRAALRKQREQAELNHLRELVQVSTTQDRLTGVLNRDSMMAALFRETDRVQRMQSSLCVVLFDIDDFGHWNTRLGIAACDDLLRQVSARASRLVRSYDLIGRMGKDEFLLALPGCSAVNAVLLAERIRNDVFGRVFETSEGPVRLSASFGIASSRGRSPVVLLREVEQALTQAQAVGPDVVRCMGDQRPSMEQLGNFLTASAGEEMLAW